MDALIIGTIPEPESVEQIRDVPELLESIGAIIKVEECADEILDAAHACGRFEVALKLTWRKNSHGKNHVTRICIDAGTGAVRQVPNHHYIVSRNNRILDNDEYTPLIQAQIGVLESSGCLKVVFHDETGEVEVEKCVRDEADTVTAEPSNAVHDHDCDDCIYLATYETSGWGPADYYHCPERKAMVATTGGHGSHQSIKTILSMEPQDAKTWVAHCQRLLKTRNIDAS